MNYFKDFPKYEFLNTYLANLQDSLSKKSNVEIENGQGGSLLVTFNQDRMWPISYWTKTLATIDINGLENTIATNINCKVNPKKIIDSVLLAQNNGVYEFSLHMIKPNDQIEQVIKILASYNSNLN